MRVFHFDIRVEIFTVFPSRTRCSSCFNSNIKENEKNFMVWRRTIRLSDFFSFFLVAWESAAGRRKEKNLHRNVESEIKKKTLLNIIEKTCCINDPALVCLSPLVLIFFSESAKGSNSESSNKVSLKDFLTWWACCNIRKFICGFRELCKFDHSGELFLMDF